MSKEASIKCPNCGTQIDVDEILYDQMQSDLNSEKCSMQRIWKEREKQIEKVLENTVGMYGSIKGIAGNSIGNVKALELPYSNIEEENE